MAKYQVRVTMAELGDSAFDTAKIALLLLQNSQYASGTAGTRRSHY
jgi:hypothetical protein